MKKLIQHIGLMLPGVILITSCDTSFKEVQHSSGSADFSRYVALGNSLTAGYQDGALYAEGQKNSYPAILAGQFGKAGGAAVFNIPYLTGDNGKYGVSPAFSLGIAATTPKLVLSLQPACDGVTGVTPGPITIPNLNNTDFYTPIFNGTYYNNMGIPGAKSWDLMRHDLGVFGFAMNPFYYRIASDNQSSGTSTVVSDALQTNPTFFTLWIGSNDILGYATSGGTGNVGGTNPNDITAANLFKTSVESTVKAMIANGADGVIGNIPDVTSIPYFTTVPYNGLELTEAAQVAQLNASYALYNHSADSLHLPEINFQVGANTFVIDDPALAPLGGIRKIKSGEYIILTVPGDSIKCYDMAKNTGGWGYVKPIPRKYVLDSYEVNNVKTYTAIYNKSIDSIATAYGLALADFNTFFKTFNAGIVFNGITYTPEYIRGGAFSLDGIHPNQRGYALIANYYIDVINKKYSSNIPRVDVNAYAGIQIP